jgi:hypothetical protein
MLAKGKYFQHFFMAKKQLILTTIFLLNMHGPQLGANWNGDKYCAACHHAKLSKADMQVVR